MALYSERGTLQPVPPFDFRRSLAFLGGFTPAAGEQGIAGEMLTRAFEIHGAAVVVRLAGGGSVETPELDYTLYAAAPLSPEAREATLARVRAYLSLDDDLRPFYAIGRDDPGFAPLVTQLYGYHQVRFPTPFENACWALLSQRTPMSAARAVKQAVAERFGAALEVDGTRYVAFPTAGRLAAAGGELEETVANGRKSGYLRGAAEAFAAVDEEWLSSAPYDEVEAWLRGIKGIGPWSASFVMLRGIGRMERAPSGEGRLAETIARRYNQGQPVSEAQIAALAARYGVYQGYWAHYLRAAG